MIGYLYQITNKINNKKYIGKTNDLNRRLQRHYIDLKNNTHHSIKLQRAFNKYGKDNFEISYEIFENISEDELALKEIEYIQKYDSYNNGYNETLGGEGHAILFDFDTTVLIYQIGQKYDGVQRLLSRYFHCDHTTIASIFRRESLALVAYDKTKLQELIQMVGITEDNLKENYKNNYSKKLSKQQVFKVLAGIEIKHYSQAACGRVYAVNKDVIEKIVNDHTYKDYKQQYLKLNENEKNALAQELEKDDLTHELQNSKKISQIKITQEIVDFIMDHQATMTQIEMARKLNLDRKRISRIAHKETYKELVDNWEKRHNIPLS